VTGTSTSVTAAASSAGLGDRPIRVGVIGTGGIANAHIAGYLKTEGIELFGACDVVKERAEAAAEKHGFKHVFTDYREMLAQPGLDLVSICTPPFAHKEPAIAALEAGKHVLCEKPMALNSKEAQEMVDAWHRVRGTHHNRFTIGFQSRWMPNAQLMKRAIDEGAMGDIYYGRAIALRRRGIPGWGVFTDKSKNGGGPMIDIGVHALDLTLWLMGHPEPASVYGVAYKKFGNRTGIYNPWGSWDPEKFSVEDAAFALIRFKNGASLQLECSWALNIEKSVFNSILAGTDGGGQLDPVRLFTEKYGTVLDIALPEKPVEGAGGTPEPPHVTEIRQFVKAVREGTDPLVMPEQALMVAKIVDAVYESSESGEAVRV
jgi:predicted dehydrogenase